MRIAKTDMPAKINVPGAVARQALDFGDATGYGKMAGEYFSLAAGADIAPLVKGLKKVGEDAEMILFSPQVEHCQVLNHLHKQLAG